MLSSRRTFTREFKLRLLRELESGKKLAQVARAYEVDPRVIRRWREELERHKENAFPTRTVVGVEEARFVELERLIGRLTMENELLKKALKRFEAPAGSRSGSTGNGSTASSGKKQAVKRS